METKRISILGCGWLGLPLGEFLAQQGHAVKGSTTQPEKLNSLKQNGINPFLISINDKQVIGEINAFLDTEILILNIPPKRIPEIIQYYPDQMKIILEQLKNSPIQHVLFVSSTSVYQNTNTLIDESIIPKPEKNSGMALVKAEKLFQNQYSFSTTIVRFAGLIGPDRNPGRFLAGKKDLDGGRNPVNLIHRDDCIRIINEIIVKECWGEIFNGCHPDHPTRKDYYTQMAQQMNLDPPIFNDGTDSPFKIVNGEKVKNVLGYQYQTNI